MFHYIFLLHLQGLLDQLGARAMERARSLGLAGRLAGRGRQTGIILLLEVAGMRIMEVRLNVGKIGELRFDAVVGRHHRVHGLARGVSGSKTMGTTMFPALANVMESIASAFLSPKEE
jgi:hypothetical protein